jgi:hypothetical protein
MSDAYARQCTDAARWLRSSSDGLNHREIAGLLEKAAALCARVEAFNTARQAAEQRELAALAELDETRTRADEVEKRHVREWRDAILEWEAKHAEAIRFRDAMEARAEAAEKERDDWEAFAHGKHDGIGGGLSQHRGTIEKLRARLASAERVVSAARDLVEPDHSNCLDTTPTSCGECLSYLTQALAEHGPSLDSERHRDAVVLMRTPFKPNVELMTRLRDGDTERRGR